MDHNRESGWPEANFAAEAQEWQIACGGTENALQANPFGAGPEPLPPSRPTSALQEVIVREAPAAALVNRHSYFFVLGLGLVLSLLSVFVSTRVLPRYLDVQQRYGFQLPRETTLALHSGMVQPIPGCAVILAGLTGLLARRPSRRHAVVTAILLLTALAVPLATAAALLIPELTLV